MRRYLGYLKYVFLALALLLVVFFVAKFANYGEKGHAITDEGLVSYSMERGIPLYSLEKLEVNNSYSLFKIIYSSDNDKIYGLLWLPKNAKKVPAVLFLPAAGGTKENEKYLAEKLTSQGYAFMAIDQRGIGETLTEFNSLQDDYELMINGQEPIAHKMIYDALRGFDVLRHHNKIDPDNIILAGSSMGGRTAMIVTALDKRVKGCFTFSSAGLNIPSGFIIDDFARTIDPDNYVSQISPRKLVMFHAPGDTLIPYSYAEKTFSLANYPKWFIDMPSPCDHGYCEKVDEELYRVLDEMFT